MLKVENITSSSNNMQLEQYECKDKETYNTTNSIYTDKHMLSKTNTNISNIFSTKTHLEKQVQKLEQENEYLQKEIESYCNEYKDTKAIEEKVKRKNTIKSCSLPFVIALSAMAVMGIFFRKKINAEIFFSPLIYPAIAVPRRAWKAERNFDNQKLLEGVLDEKTKISSKINQLSRKISENNKIIESYKQELMNPKN